MVDGDQQEDTDGPCSHRSKQGVTPGKVSKPKKKGRKKTQSFPRAGEKRKRSGAWNK